MRRQQAQAGANERAQDHGHAEQDDRRGHGGLGPEGLAPQDGPHDADAAHEEQNDGGDDVLDVDQALAGRAVVAGRRASPVGGHDPHLRVKA